MLLIVGGTLKNNNNPLHPHLQTFFLNAAIATLFMARLKWNQVPNDVEQLSFACIIHKTPPSYIAVCVNMLVN